MHRTVESLAMPAATSQDVLTDVLRDGAAQLLAQALEAEVATRIENHKQLVDEVGHRMIVRNGHLPTRTIVTGVGSVAVTQPRVHDRRPEDTVGEDGQGVALHLDHNKQPVQQAARPHSWCNRKRVNPM
ncbi:MAG: hypothetical protein JSU63_03580 [Phycisphaerales bacterium]|nr:MAG: hypothetical protein JSU63_03580 [Phycisphaerales bacterium]